MSVSRRRWPSAAFLLLAICLLAVGSHFLGECFTQAKASPMESPHAAYDLVEDQFLVTSANTPSARSSGAWGASPLLQSLGLAGLAPPDP